MAAVASPCKARPRATRGCGRCRAAMQSERRGSLSEVRPCRWARPSAARPGWPETQISSPARAPLRRRAFPAATSPKIVTQKLRGPRVVSPPIRSMPNSSAQANTPRAKAATHASSTSGRAIAKVAQRGFAPIAAISETLTARVFQPRSSGLVSGRKWVPSTSMSVEITSSQPRLGAIRAPSSPTPSVVWVVPRVK